MTMATYDLIGAIADHGADGVPGFLYIIGKRSKGVKFVVHSDSIGVSKSWVPGHPLYIVLLLTCCPVSKARRHGHRGDEQPMIRISWSFSTPEHTIARTGLNMYMPYVNYIIGCN